MTTIIMTNGAKIVVQSTDGFSIFYVLLAIALIAVLGKVGKFGKLHVDCSF